MHKNARLTLIRRREMVQALQRGDRQRDIAERFEVSTNTVRKWWRRFLAEGVAGLVDRSSRPNHSPTAISAEEAEEILALRHASLVGVEIAVAMGRAVSTVSKVLRSARLSRQADLDRNPEPKRYEHQRPGDMLHVDIKRFGKFAKPGHRFIDRASPDYSPSKMKYEYAHVCIDDHSRVSYVEILEEGETGPGTAGFLQRAVAYFKELGVEPKRVLSDNGSGYKSGAFRDIVDELGMKHSRTRPYSPQTNGKAERFIQTLQREWAYVREYESSAARRKTLQPWLKRYNEVRPHGSLGRNPPMSRLEVLK